MAKEMKLTAWIDMQFGKINDLSWEPVQGYIKVNGSCCYGDSLECGLDMYSCEYMDSVKRSEVKPLIKNLLLERYGVEE
jgi:hypothetical protein